MKLINLVNVFVTFVAHLLLPLIVAYPENAGRYADSGIEELSSNDLAKRSKLPVVDNLESALLAPVAISGGKIRTATAAEITTHKFYTKLSASAYCRSVIPGGQFSCKTCDRSLHMVQTFKTPIYDVNAMILRGDRQKTIYVVFRGTSSVENVVFDNVIFAVDYPHAKGVKVHKGFFDSYNSVRNGIVKVLEEQVRQYPDYKVDITGHSLGGSLALLCGLDLFNTDSNHYGLDKLSIYTQGQPRVGDIAFAKYVATTKLRYQRLVSNRDIVPHLPPQLPNGNFMHAGEEFWINGGAVQVCTNELETKDCSNSLLAASPVDHVDYFGVVTGVCLE